MYLTKTDAEAGLYRFYALHLVPGLFGDWSLVREWGRIGSPGTVRTDWFPDERAAKDARFLLHMAKAKRGYG